MIHACCAAIARLFHRLYVFVSSRGLSLEVIDISIVLSLRYLSVILLFLLLLPFSSWVSFILSFRLLAANPLFGCARALRLPFGQSIDPFRFLLHSRLLPLSLICFSSLVILPHNSPPVVSSTFLYILSIFIQRLRLSPSLLSLLLSSYASKYPLFHLTSRV